MKVFLPSHLLVTPHFHDLNKKTISSFNLKLFRQSLVKLNFMPIIIQPLRQSVLFVKEAEIPWILAGNWQITTLLHVKKPVTIITGDELQVSIKKILNELTRLICYLEKLKCLWYLTLMSHYFLDYEFLHKIRLKNFQYLYRVHMHIQTLHCLQTSCPICNTTQPMWTTPYWG